MTWWLWLALGAVVMGFLGFLGWQLWKLGGVMVDGRGDEGL